MPSLPIRNRSSRRTVRPFLAGIIVLCGALLASCASHQFLNVVTPKSGYTVSTNLPYDQTNSLRLDVYTPTPTSSDPTRAAAPVRNAPVVVFLYGGRWESTYTHPKEDYGYVGEALTSQGFVAVIPDYRVYPAVTYPTFIQDSADAIAWVHANIGRFGGDPSKIVVMGHSSGAYNAAMIALNDSFLEKAGGTREWLKGMIGIAGAYDFLPITDPTLRAIFGAPENYNATQPVFNVDGKNPPMLLIHGENDNVVPVSNTRELASRIQRAGGTIETLIYPDLEHEWSLSVLAKVNRSRADELQQISDYVRRVTHSSATSSH